MAKAISRGIASQRLKALLPRLKVGGFILRVETVRRPPALELVGLGDGLVGLGDVGNYALWEGGVELRRVVGDQNF